MTMQTIRHGRGYIHMTTTGNDTTYRAQDQDGQTKECGTNLRAAQAWCQRYQGHKNWNHWNVSLWIANEYPLYQLAVDALRRGRNLEHATTIFLREVGTTRTPDGGHYSRVAVRAALESVRD